VKASVEALGSKSPDLATARWLTTEFIKRLEHLDAKPLAPWLAAASEGESKAFAADSRRGYDAALAASLFQWNNG
jgi:hypothetical protein